MHAKEDDRIFVEEGDHAAAQAIVASTPEAALRAAAVDFEEITIRLKRDKQLRSYRTSLGLKQ